MIEATTKALGAWPNRRSYVVRRVGEDYEITEVPEPTEPCDCSDAIEGWGCPTCQNTGEVPAGLGCAWEGCEGELVARLTAATVEGSEVKTHRQDVCADHVDPLAELWQTRGAAVDHVPWDAPFQVQVPAPKAPEPKPASILPPGEPGVIFDAQPPPPKYGITVADHLKQFQLFIHRLANLVWQEWSKRPDVLVVTPTLWGLVACQTGYQDDPQMPSHRTPYKVGHLRGLLVMIDPHLPQGQGYVSRSSLGPLNPLGNILVTNL